MRKIPPTIEHEPQGKLILLVDDEFDLIWSYTALFELAGFRVHSVVNGQEALVAAAIEPPDIVLSDYMMPVMDGAQLCLAWRADPALRGIPFILSSAGSLRTDITLPYDSFFKKPIHFEPLLAEVRRLLSRHEQR